MYDSRNTLIDVQTTNKRAFAFIEYNEAKASEYIAVVVISRKTGKQLVSYDVDMSELENVRQIKTLGALVAFGIAEHTEYVFTVGYQQCQQCGYNKCIMDSCPNCGYSWDD